MFERYTERARRVIFFARYEASQLGDSYIETQHLLLGLVREEAGLLLDFINQEQALSIRQQIESEAAVRNQGQPKLPTSVDLPLSNESKRVLAYSAEEAERLRDRHIGVEHMLLGLLREQGTFAAKLLEKNGLELNAIREHLKSPRATRFFLILLDPKNDTVDEPPTIASSSSTSKLAKGLELSESMPIIRCRELAISYYFSRARLE